MDSPTRSKHSFSILALPLRLLRRVFSSTLPGLWFFLIDYALQILLLIQIGYTSNQTGQRIISNDNIPHWFLPWYFCHWLFVSLTWAFGYIGLSPETPKRHFYIALLRLGFSTASVTSVVLARIYILEYWLVTFYIGFAWILSISHFCGAIQRVRRHWRMQQELVLNPENNFINLMTGSKMIYLSNEERIRMKARAAEAMSGSIGKDEFWYHPHVPIETKWQDSRQRFPFYKPVEQFDMVDDLLDGHFSPCHCCLPTDPVKKLADIDEIDNRSRSSFYSHKNGKQWQEERSLFLGQTASRHKSVVVPRTDESPEFPAREDYQPHALCDKCLGLCNSSFLIELARGWTFQTYFKYLLRAFTWEPLVEECFEHWPTPTVLREKAQNGCHLCTLIWQTLNSEQQDELLAYDSDLASLLERELSILGGREEDRESLQAQFHSRRCIRVKIQSPWAQKRWKTSWDKSHCSKALRLVPHFGQRRVARRWMKRKFAYRAISIDQDPTLSWDMETVEAIEIVATYPRHLGPILLPLSRSTSSKTTMAFITSWLQAHEHPGDTEEIQDYGSDVDDPLPGSIGLERLNFPKQRPNSEIGFLPSRLIDVGLPERPLIRIRLCKEIEHEYRTAQSRAINPDCRYIAFSHCWGKPKFATLTKANVSEFRKSIPTDILAQTFQDAIVTTRALGLRFVWIDSLCIIQDSNEDWQREAASMKDIYTNAYFVLAAAKAWDSSETFFADQNPLAMTPCLLATRASKASISSQGHGQRGFGCIYAYPLPRYWPFAEATLELCKLKSRAWCYQELALAQRIVYFADHQVILECKDKCKKTVYQVQWKNMNVFNSYPYLIFPEPFGPVFKMAGKMVADTYRASALPRWLRSWSRTQPRNVSTSTPARHEPSHKAVATYEALPQVLLKQQWWSEVFKYSSCLLTMEKDKLQALAGIAARYQAQVNAQDLDCEYLAGLWQSPFLVTGLLWYVSQGHQNVRSEQYRAPSWSWASVDGTIMNNSLEGGDSFEFSGIDILEATVVGPSAENLGNEKQFPLGTCTGGSLLIRGVLKKARVKELAEGVRKYYVGHSARKIRVKDEGDLKVYVSLSNDPTSGPLVRELESEMEPSITIGYLIPDTLDDIPSEIHCLQIVVKPDCRSGEEDFSVPYVTRGLALVPIEPGRGDSVNECAYRRIGYIEIEHTLGGVTAPNTFSLPWNSRAEDGRAVRSPAPNIDVAGFFRYTTPEEVRIV